MPIVKQIPTLPHPVPVSKDGRFLCCTKGVVKTFNQSIHFRKEAINTESCFSDKKNVVHVTALSKTVMPFNDVYIY